MTEHSPLKGYPVWALKQIKIAYRVLLEEAGKQCGLNREINILPCLNILI